MIQIQSVSKIYNMGEVQVHALREVSLQVESGEMVAIMGPSGSGKSTLMNVLGCLDRPTSGTYILDGKEVGRLGPAHLAEIRNRKLGFVFQGYNLLPRLSAMGNVELPMLYGGTPHRRERALKALEAVGLGGRAKHRPTELSGGEQQRVAIARAVSKNPKVLLCDEPTGALDSATGVVVLEAIHRINHRLGTTTAVITHNADIARIADRVIYLSNGLVSKIAINTEKQEPRDLHW